MRLSCDRVLLVLLLVSPMFAFSHGDEAHDDDSRSEEQAAAPPGGTTSTEKTSLTDTSVDNSTSVTSTVAPSTNSDVALRPLGDLVNDLSLSDFPTLHPVVVHVPVTLVPIAFFFSIVLLFSTNRVFVWLTLGFAAVGLVGGIVAAYPLHPHTSGLSEAAKVTLEKHDFFAYSTLWLTFVSSLVALLCVWKPARIVKAGLCVLLLFSALAVAVTGHYGGTLAYVHGIGIQGQFLSTH